MGWTSYTAMYYKKNGTIDRKAECDYEINRCGGNVVLKSAMVGSVYYAAVMTISTGEVWAAVFLTSVDGNEFFYKDMDESVGPYDCKCPKSILNLLTPTDNEHANTWRESCLEYHKKANSQKAFKNIKEGQKAVWTVPHDRFTGLSKGDKVVMTKAKVNGGKRCVWLLNDMGCYVSSKHIDQDNYELID